MKKEILVVISVALVIVIVGCGLWLGWYAVDSHHQIEAFAGLSQEFVLEQQETGEQPSGTAPTEEIGLGFLMTSKCTILIIDIQLSKSGPTIIHITTDLNDIGISIIIYIDESSFSLLMSHKVDPRNFGKRIITIIFI